MFDMNKLKTLAQVIADTDVSIRLNEQMVADHIRKATETSVRWLKNHHVESCEFALERIRELEMRRNILENI